MNENIFTTNIHEPTRTKIKYQSTGSWLNKYIIFLVGIFLVVGLPAQTGDAAIAEKYVIWAEEAITAGQWTRARAALERAADFADVSSDVSYLLALTRSRTNDNRGSVLRAVQQAIRTGRWSRYSEMRARILEAEQLIALRLYPAALNSIKAGIAAIPAAGAVDGNERAEFAKLNLAVLKGMVSGAEILYETDSAAHGEFRRAVGEAMELFPREPWPLRFLFSYARNRQPDEEDITLMDQALKRLPFLIEHDPDLAWMAAPFIGDTEEARRLVAGYRSGSFRLRPSGISQGGSFTPNKASIIPALNLGLLDDIDAVEELFFPAGTEIILDKDIINETGDLLRSSEGRDRLAQTLLSFTGIITEDRDRDGIPESRAVYKQGALQEFYYDAEQGGLDDMIILFNSGSPLWAEISALPSAGVPQAGLPLVNPQKAIVIWERYPSVQRVVMGGETFLFTPGGFHSAPVNFEELGATGNYAGLLFPRRNYSSPGIGLRMLLSAAYIVQRPSFEFEGGTEQIFLRQGLPVRSEVTLNGKIVSVTEFENGRPVIQRVDMIRDGRLDTVRRFRVRGGDPLDGYPWIYGPEDYRQE